MTTFWKQTAVMGVYPVTILKSPELYMLKWWMLLYVTYINVTKEHINHTQKNYMELRESQDTPEEEGQGLALSDTRMCYQMPIIKTGMPGVLLKSGTSVPTLLCIFSFHDGPPRKYHRWHSTNVCVHLIPVTHEVINHPVSGTPHTRQELQRAVSQTVVHGPPAQEPPVLCKEADSRAPLPTFGTRSARGSRVLLLLVEV